MKEKELVDLGFRRRNVSAEESGYDNDWYYYEYDFNTSNISLITQANEEVKGDEWTIEIFEPKRIQTTKSLVNAIKRNIKI